MQQIETSMWRKVAQNGYRLDLKVAQIMLSTLRNKETIRSEFVSASDQLFSLLLNCVLSMQETKEIEKISGTGINFKSVEFTNQKICLIPILRSGEAVASMGKQLTNDVAFAHILLQRDETTEDKNAIFFYKKFPKDIVHREVYLVDPMLATGNSAIAALDLIQQQGVDMNKVRFVNLVSCPEGLEALYKVYPEVNVYTVGFDEKLNEQKYIIPGLGDFGDRYYGTE